jgi:hypothetical protein
VLIIGLLSFIEPLIITDPPVMGHARWSPLDIARGLYDGKLPRDANKVTFWTLPLHFALIYLLLIMAAGCLWLFPGQALPGYMGVIGAIMALETWRLELDMKSLFYGNPMLYGGHTSGHVKPAALVSQLFLVMIALAFLSSAKASPANPQHSERRPRWRLKSLK